ncbi:MAG: nitrilase-related carbon-nitrogen hydrolase [Candidatus Eisenbacteria bacterium]
MSTFRIGFVQGRPQFGRAAENLESALALAAPLAAELVVLPELWSSGYVFSSHAEVALLAEDAGRGATARALSAAARRERRHYVAGFPERHRGRFYNSAMLVGPAGVRAVYRKLHLFEREREWFSPGNLPLAVHRVGPARVGLMICFDWRFPEVARVLALEGADVLAHPSNLVFPNAQEAMRTRSIENRVYTITANRIGTENREGGRVPFTGRSQIVAPSGEVLARAGKGVVVAQSVGCDLSQSRDKSLTAITPIFSSRRPEFYGRLTRRTPSAPAKPRARATAAARGDGHRVAARPRVAARRAARTVR